jgi:cytochrome c oxidase subunit 2
MAEAPSTLDAAGHEARVVASLWWWMLGTAVVVYLVVGGLVLVTVVRRHRQAEPQADRSGWFLWWGGLIVPSMVLAGLAIATVAVTVDVRRAGVSELDVDVTAHDWWWEVRYPGNSLRTSNVVHLPVDRTSVLHLRSDDVVHSLWIPQLAGKLDVVPGQTNVLRLTPTRLGTYLGECAEFCGIQHANMRFTVVVETSAAFEAWVRGPASPTPTPGSDEAAGQSVFVREACAGCHTIEGTSARGTRGPDLTDFAARDHIAAGTVANTPENLRAWIRDPDAIKPGVLMPGFDLDPADLHDLVAYLESRR